MSLKRLSLFSVLVLAVLLAGLPQAFAQVDSPVEENSAFVRFANLSPDAGAVTISVGNEMNNADGLEFGEFSDWQAITPGEYTVSVAPAGDAAAEAMFGPATYTLSTTQWITIVAVGSVADNTLSTVVVEEEYAPMAPGVTNITFFNGLGDQTVNFVRDDTEFVSELGVPNNPQGLNASSSFAIDSGTYHFVAHPTADPDMALGELSEADVKENDLYFLAIVENASGETELILEPTRWAEVEIAQGNLSEPGTLVDVSSTHSLLGAYAETIAQAGLSETLSGETMYTIFAPSDDFLDNAIEQYANDREGLATYLRSHIVEGDLRFQDLMETDSLTALDGSTLTLRVEGNTVYVNGAPILTPNVSAMNGTIHIIGLAANEG